VKDCLHSVVRREQSFWVSIDRRPVDPVAPLLDEEEEEEEEEEEVEPSVVPGMGSHATPAAAMRGTISSEKRGKRMSWVGRTPA
jgi:hypothetical protein